MMRRSRNSKTLRIAASVPVVIFGVAFVKITVMADTAFHDDHAGHDDFSGWIGGNSNRWPVFHRALVIWPGDNATGGEAGNGCRRGECDVCFHD
jgi:hypothetical protein